MAHPTLDELYAERDRLKAEAVQLRDVIVKGMTGWVPGGTPVPMDLYTAFNELLRASAALQHVEESISAIH